MVRAPNRRPIVWVVNRGQIKNFGPAEQFGEVHVIFEGSVNIFQQEQVENTFRTALEGATGDDFVLIVGYSFLNGLAMSYFLEKFGVLKSLIWVGSKTKGEYRAMTTYPFWHGNR